MPDGPTCTTTQTSRLPGGTFAAVQVRLLGHLELVVDGQAVPLGGAKERALLAALAIRAGQTVSEDRLTDALWGDDPPVSARKSLQSYVARLRKALGDCDGLSIESRPGGYALESAPDSLDVGVVERLTLAARAAADPLEAARRYAEALALWRGPALGDLASEPFALAEAARLDELRVALTEAWVEAELACGRHHSLIGELERLCAEHPLREGLWAARMLALYRSGRQAEALRAFQELRRQLGDELGIEPSPGVAALETAILRQDPALAFGGVVASGSGAPVVALPVGLPSGVVTFLLTDVEGSTPLWESAPKAMAVALARHDELMAAAVAANNGTLLKARGEGDSTFSVFARATDAALAALAAQVAIAAEAWPDGAELRVRMAIHTGEALERDGDYYGTTVNRVARLRGLADGNQILVSRPTADVIIDHLEDAVLVELGVTELKGLTRPEPLYELVAAGAAPIAVTAPVSVEAMVQPPVPSPLAQPEGAFFVGRDTELKALEIAWSAAVAGNRRAVLIGGEPGVGKTRLASELACRAHGAGAIVLFGRSDDGLGVPYQPFVEALRTIVATAPPFLLRERLGRRAADLTRIVPELGDVLPGLSPPTRGDAETERYLLFEAVVATIGVAAGAQPLLLVLDDLHWAAKPTLLLLRHLLQAETPMPLLIVGTYRDTELDRAHPLAEVLADLRRVPGVERLSVRGLDEVGVIAFVAAAAGHELDDRGVELARALHVETEGNPFFVAEVLAHLVETGALYQDESGRWTAAEGVAADDLGLPEGVREVITRRLGRLSENTNRVLTVASVVGANFSLALLEKLVDGDVFDPLDEAVAAGLVSEAPGGYTFAHALVRQTLYSELTGPRRMRLHRQVGEAIEQLPDPDAHLDALAYHFAEAALDGQAAKAADYAVAAGRQAYQRLADDEAVVIFDRAVAALELERNVDELRMARLLIGRGLARYRARTEGAWETGRTDILNAAMAARRAGSPTLMAQAALAGSDIHVFGTPDPAFKALFEEALNSLPVDEVALRTRLLSARAVSLAFGEQRGTEARVLAAEALALARDLGDQGLLLEALLSHQYVLDGTPNFDERSALLDEIVVMAQARNDVDAVLTSWILRSYFAIEEGRFNDVRAAIEEIPGDAHTGSLPIGVNLRAACALAIGDWDSAEAMAEIEAAWAAKINIPIDWSMGHFFLSSLERGNVGEIEPLLEAAASENPGILLIRAALVLARTALGKQDAARSGLGEFVAAGQLILPDDRSRSAVGALLAEPIARLRERELAAQLYKELAPWIGHTLVMTNLGCFGAADRFLGMLAATMDEFDKAEAHFEHALALELQMETPPLVARTRYWYARMLLERDRTGDRARAVDLLGGCIATADELGMALLAQAARELLRPPLPRSLVQAEGAYFVGRDDEFAKLSAAWDQVRAGERRAMLLSGEPGIGKTRLAAEFCSRAYADGAVVLFGRCDEGMGVPYQPFVEALRGFIAMVPPANVASYLGHHVQELAKILPELREMSPDLAPAHRDEPEAERYRLFEAVAAALVAASRERPVVLVLDDLHWAAKPTLLLLKHVLQAEAPMPLLIVGTYRDTELGRAHPLAEVLSDLRRVPGVERVAVGGLDEHGVSDFVVAAAGHDLDDRARELAAALHIETQGNPFFIGEVLAHLVETGALFQNEAGRWAATPGSTTDDLGLPEGVREVITRRLGRLSDATNQLLTVASVIGPSFTLSLLGAIADSIDIVDALDEALAARLIVERSPGYTFAHALVRQTLYSELSGPKRMRLHRRVGEAIESLPGADQHVAALAYHFAEAALDGQVAKAVDYALATADRALGNLAFEDACTVIRRGLEIVEFDQPVDHGRRCDLLVLLARSEYGGGSWKTISLRAAQDARAIGDGERLARAAIQYNWGVEVGAPDHVGRELAEEALAVLGESNPNLRTELMANLAFYLYAGEGATAAGAALGAEALERARQSGDVELLRKVLLDFVVLLDGSPRVGDRLAIRNEVLALGEVNRATTSFVIKQRAIDQLELGDRTAFDRDAQESDRLQVDLPHNFQPIQLRAFSCILDGRFEDAEDQLGLFLGLPSLAGNVFTIYAVMLFCLRREQGRLSELRPLVAEAVENTPGLRALRALLGLMFAELGEHDAARAVVEELAADGFATLARDMTWTAALAGLSETCALLGDAEHSAALYDLFIEHQSHVVVGGWGSICLGSVDRFIGMLCATSGRVDDARVHYETALGVDEGLRSPPNVARTQLWYGRLLVENDRDRAAQLFQAARETAEALGMAGLAAEAGAELSSL